MKKNKEQFSRVFEAFKVDKSNIESIYKYAPVFKCKYKDVSVILKKTKSKEENARRLFRWTAALKDEGIGVVTPIEIDGKYTMRIDDDLWVMYPFIEGRKYNGSLEDIKKAGQFLGRMHTAGKNRKMLINEFSWEEYDDEFVEEVKSDLDIIKKKYHEHIDNNILEKLKKSIENMVCQKFASLRDVQVPMVNGCWDYKTNNLVYGEGDIPVLIDPDGGGYIPRLFDLALALILFHTEMDTAPGRIFTEVEWNSFKEGYFQYVELTDKEKELWEEYLLFVFIDEALWAIVNLEEDEPQRQQDFMKSLLEFDPRIYKL